MTFGNHVACPIFATKNIALNDDFVVLVSLLLVNKLINFVLKNIILHLFQGNLISLRVRALSLQTMQNSSVAFSQHLRKYHNRQHTRSTKSKYSIKASFCVFISILPVHVFVSLSAATKSLFASMPWNPYLPLYLLCYS